VDTSLRNDVGVEAVAKVNRVDVVTAKNRLARVTQICPRDSR
jgi:hypothetical protein